MRTTKHAWTRAFPTVFQPYYNEARQCVSFHGDITGDYNVRKEREVSWHDWGRWLVWHDDGRPSRHPTFALILYIELFKRQLHQQIQDAVNISSFDPCRPIGDIFHTELSTDENVNNFTKKINHFVPNVRGTDQYFWKIK